MMRRSEVLSLAALNAAVGAQGRNSQKLWRLFFSVVIGDRSVTVSGIVGA